MNLGNLFKKKTGKSGFPKISRDGILVWGTIASVVLLCFFLALDWYFFSTANQEAPPADVPVASSAKKLSEQDIQKTLQLLDAREEKFRDLTGPSSTIQATTTSAASTTFPSIHF